MNVSVLATNVFLRKVVAISSLSILLVGCSKGPSGDDMLKAYSDSDATKLGWAIGFMPLLKSNPDAVKRLGLENVKSESELIERLGKRLILDKSECVDASGEPGFVCTFRSGFLETDGTKTYSEAKSGRFYKIDSVWLYEDR